MWTNLMSRNMVCVIFYCAIKDDLQLSAVPGGWFVDCVAACARSWPATLQAFRWPLTRTGWMVSSACWENLRHLNGRNRQRKRRWSCSEVPNTEAWCRTSDCTDIETLTCSNKDGRPSSRRLTLLSHIWSSSDTQQKHDRSIKIYIYFKHTFIEE